MSYLAIAAHCVEASRSRGFTQSSLDTAPYRILAIHSEIIELREAIRSGTQREISLESADLAIYTLVLMFDLGNDNWVLRGRMHGGPRAHCSPAEMVAPLHDYADKAYRAWRRGSKTDVLVSLELLLAMLVDIRKRCLGLTNGLQEDVAHKLALDAARPKLNGHADPRS